MNTLSQLFLQSAQFYTLVLIIVIGLVFIDRRIFLRALSILLFSMVFNAFLKSFFKIPLKAHFKSNWYAFPSGHANAATTFYGYLLHRFKNPWLTLIGVTLIMGVCWALVHNHYHDWMDVTAAVGFSTLLIFIFHWLETTNLFKDNCIFLLLLITIVAYGLVKISPAIQSHTAIPLGALIGVTVTTILEKIFGYQSIHPVIDFLIIIGGILGLQALFAKLNLNSYTYTVLEYGLISWCGTYSPHIFAKLKR
jgi:hypothetical protein